MKDLFLQLRFRASYVRVPCVRHTTRVVTIAFSLVISWMVQTAYSQEPELAIGGQVFRVGMSRSEAMAKLDACCRLTGSDDSFFIQTKSGPPFKILGAIWFTSGRVSALRLDRLHSEDVETAAFGLSLYRIVLDLAPSPAAATISTKTSEVSNGTDRTITIAFNNRKILTISVGNVDGKATGFVQISEER